MCQPMPARRPTNIVKESPANHSRAPLISRAVEKKKRPVKRSPILFKKKKGLSRDRRD